MLGTVLPWVRLTPRLLPLAIPPGQPATATPPEWDLAAAWEWGAEAALAAAAVSGSRGSVKDQAKSYLKEV